MVARNRLDFTKVEVFILISLLQHLKQEGEK